MSFNARFYLSIFRRRLPYFLTVMVVVAAAGIALAMLLPAKYRAETLLLVESEQIPDKLAASTVQTGVGEELQIIEQRLMTRPNLLDISRKFGIHADRPDMDPTAIVADMRARSHMDSKTAKNLATTLTVSFDGASARQALDVTNELVTRLQQENIAIRTARAGQTLEFFRQEVSRLGSDLDRQSADILAFQEANRDSLPDSLTYRRGRQEALQERALDLQRQAAALKDRRARLVELYARTGQIEAISPDQMTPEQRQLQALRTQLADALLVYSDQNPRVKLLQARLAALEKTVAQQSVTAGESAAGSAMSLYDVQLSEIDGQAAYIADQQKLVEEALAALQVSIDATPGNAARLSELERENEITKGQYTAAVNRLAQAQTGERIEVLSKGQRISIVEPAVLPVRPYSPPRKIIVAGSLAGGLLLGLGLVLALEFFNQAIRRPSDIVSALGITPIATLPFVASDARGRSFSLVRGPGGGVPALRVAAALALVLAGLLLAVHSLVMPLDVAAVRLAGQAGIALPSQSGPVTAGAGTP